MAVDLQLLLQPRTADY